ncbi:predicted protein [Pyrenophora tritici-repentis Pt-1C-BFP]|uniref:Uncharacterized protein n=1 Tax=Pyrenophora tritici-repentis (strain Pt-1C-BFP) TaxID=426418 RepID=B2VYN1_PYRTR|nr:uncharacterized protein PTRG_02521 [Pyrenophora tritici-repentis Pt-1C-BFP]EDU45044.1 predicted protein [Pyrenophora tritici-repentis Pt-1C-BFP]
MVIVGFDVNSRSVAMSVRRSDAALTQGIGQRHAQHSSARPPSPPDLHQSRLQTVDSPWAEGNA